MALSEYILNIGKQIEQKSGVKLNITLGNMAPTQEWVPDSRMSEMKVIQLRTADQTQNEEPVKLKQFNLTYSLKEPSKISCRVPGCSATTPRREPIYSSEKIKQAFFLCESHRTVLSNLVFERCAKENVTLNFTSYRHEDFNGYKNLIGLLEKAFMHLKTKSPILSMTDSLLAEVFLNTRNFLIITSSLLSPDEDNMNVVLGPYVVMFEKFLNSLNDLKLLRNLLVALREVMNVVMLFFGTIYGWVFFGNPGGRIGAGVGIAVGFVGALAWGLPPATIFASSVVGLIAGYLIGSGGYDLYRERLYMKLQQQIVQNCQQFIVFERIRYSVFLMPLYNVRANAEGDLLLDIRENK